MDSANGLNLITTLIPLIIVICAIAANWIIFQKAGESGWKCLVPFYSSYISAKIVFGNGWLFLIQLIPCVCFIYMFIHSILLAKAFGKGLLFGIAMAFISPLRFIIAFDNSEYLGPQKL